MYEYAVGGVSYSSSNISFTADQDSVSGCGFAREALKSYPPGKAVSVYYDPQNPKDSVLIPGGTNFGILGFSLLALFAGFTGFANTEIARRHSGSLVR